MVPIWCLSGISKLWSCLNLVKVARFYRLFLIFIAFLEWPIEITLRPFIKLWLFTGCVRIQKLHRLLFQLDFFFNNWILFNIINVWHILKRFIFLLTNYFWLIVLIIGVTIFFIETVLFCRSIETTSLPIILIILSVIV